MHPTGKTAEHQQATPAEEYRMEARIRLKPGESASRVHGGRLQLIRLVLTDEGPLAQEDGTTIEQPEVVCTMRPEEARRRAVELLQAAGRAEQTSHIGERG